ncbi:actinoporin-like protein [Amia ocellicauda]|uniref:actinoporin-like protein n=1 Tax=Amia ocellicauda TaxID=2972642 RepID=UPI0034642A2C|nr:ACTPA protein [Amia calva]
MAENAEAIAANVSTNRNVTVEISNLTSNYCLLNPRIFLESGHVYNPPQPTIRPMKTEVCTFSKIASKVEGAVGVMTYDLFERNRKDYIESMAIMFSVPFDYNMYKNRFAVGIYSRGRNCDQSLYKEMYNSKDHKGFVSAEATGTAINHVGDYLDIKATMCPMGRAIMKVEVWDKLFTPYGQQAMSY